MKQALKVVEEIKLYQTFIRTTPSVIHRKKYQKTIKKLIEELKYYASYKKGVDFNQLMELIEK